MPTLTLDFDPEDYGPATRYPWNATPPGGGAAVPANWAPLVEWEDANLIDIPDDSGLYIIENDLGMGPVPYYAGQAASFLNRFNARSRTFHEFGLTSGAVIPNYNVRVAILWSAPPTFGALTLAERWLVRFLFCRDFAIGVHHMQNIALTDPFNAPPTGLSIRYDPNVAPAYLHDATAMGFPGWVAPAANSVGFNYAGGTVVLP